MIYSKLKQTYIPVTVECTKSEFIPYFGRFTRYIVRDDKIPVGKVDLKDINDGVHVEYIQNMNPQLYSGFGTIADQIEVEHCLKRKLPFFQILSEAALNSHALHYLRGKRFEMQEDNEKVKKIIESTPAGQRFDTKSMGKVRMFMPLEMIEKYLEIIKKCPLLK